VDCPARDVDRDARLRLALTDPSFYLAAIMKTVTLSQQAGETDARSAGHELVGSTLMAPSSPLGSGQPVAVA
jgi:hypothetical protein